MAKFHQGVVVFGQGIGECGIPIPAVLLSWATFVVAGGFNRSNRKL
jgi:hypothetical protein